MINKCFNIEDLHQLAEKRLPKAIFDYMAGGSDDEKALKNNTSSFDNYQLIPNTLCDVREIYITTQVLGCNIAMPFYISPIGQSRFFHPDSDLAGARAAANFNTIFTLSTFSGKPLEEVADATDGDKMFQVYVMTDHAQNLRLIDRCKDAGYKALCLTVDTIVPGNREKDFRNGLTIPPKLSLSSALDFATKPRWVYNYITDKGQDLANLENVPSMKNTKEFLQYMGALLERNLTWQHAKEMVEYWDGPFAVKGILSVADAKRAVEIGATTIIISNHGGRQLDSAPAPIEVLADIRAAVGDEVEIIIDGGIRRGSDIIKAIALGATACSIGRAYVYGLGSAGQLGVERALTLLKAEVERDMALLGCTSLSQLNPTMIKERFVRP
jgi:L-lactate dehydrogenase (cytochrome)